MYTQFNLNTREGWLLLRPFLTSCSALNTHAWDHSWMHGFVHTGTHEHAYQNYSQFTIEPTLFKFSSTSQLLNLYGVQFAQRT